MALLAEQKRKVKFGLDPRNTSWSNDNSKFGQRLMEKMGWEKGKGLGANENGMTEHIKASYKSDTTGLGCTPQAADAWIAHQDDFNDLLKMLNSQSETGDSEEKTDKTTNVDGHKRYHGRFARGQAQTLRSTTDLDCIFGRRKTKSEISEPDEQPKVGSADSGDTGEHGLTTVTSTRSVQEYFAKKMADMQARKDANTGQNMLNGSEDSGETETDKIDDKHKTSKYGAVNFSYNNDEKETVSSTNDQTSRGWYQNFTEDNVPNLVAEEKSSKKKKKSKKNKKEKDAAEDCDIEIKLSKKEKKLKDKQKTEDLLLSVGTHKESCVPDLLTISSIEDSKLSKKKETKEVKSTINNVFCVPSSDVVSEKKKRKSKRECTEETVIEGNSEGKSEKDAVEDCDIEIKLSKKEKTKLKDKQKTDEDLLFSVSTHKASCVSDLLPVSNIEDSKLSKKMKKKETKEVKSTINNLFCVTSSDVISEKKKKKKSKRECTEETVIEGNSDSNVLAVETCKKNKRKKCDIVDVNTNTHSTKKTDIDNTETDKGKRKSKCDSAEVTSHCEGQKKKKRKYSQTDADEVSVSVEDIISSNDGSEVTTKKKKKQRKEKNANDPDEENKTDGTATGEQMINKDSSSLQMKNHYRRLLKKARRKQKEKGKGNVKSNQMFPGSNIEKIVGYGLKEAKKDYKNMTFKSR